MAFVLMAVGALMLVGGGALSILGLPYLVLERGFTQVIMGSVVATGGVVVLALGLALRSLRPLLARAGTASSLGAATAAGVGAAAAAASILDQSETEAHHPRLPHIDEPAATPPRDEPILTEPVSVSEPEATTETPKGDEAAMSLKLSPEDRLFSDNYDELRHSLMEPDQREAEAFADENEPSLAVQEAVHEKDEPTQPAGPTASDEGIVGVRVIGDSTFTMYASGAVRAETPAGVLTFSSITELKEHLAKAAVA